MKLPFLALFIALVMSQSARGQEPSFFYLVEWGEGSVPGIGAKIDKVLGIDPVEDGYIFQLLAFCGDTTIRLCTRFVKMDYSGHVLWQRDFSDPDTNFISLSGSIESWVIENRYYSFFDYGVPSTGEGKFLFSVFDVDDGSSLFEQHYQIYELDFINNIRAFFPVSDSLFLLAGNYLTQPDKFVPALRWIRRSDGAVVKSVNVMEVFQNQSNELMTLSLRSDGGLNFSIGRRKTLADPSYGPNFAGGYCYTGVMDEDGHILSLHFTGDHTGFGFPTFPPVTGEVTLPNNKRFLVSGIDTTVSEELLISNLFKTYYLEEDGFVIKDSLFHFPGDTIYRVTDLDLAENGDVLVAGELFNWANIQCNTQEIFLMRYDQQGALLWHKTYAPFFFQQYNNRVFVHQVEADIDGGILITGSFYRALDTILTSPNGERYGFILKVGPDGCYFNNCEGGFILTDVSEAPVIDLAAPLRIFPNPAADELNLQFFRPVHGAIRIYDAMGRLHWSGASSGAPDQQIGLGNWPPGFYLLQLEEEGRRYALKFVKM